MIFTHIHPPPPPINVGFKIETHLRTKCPSIWDTTLKRERGETGFVLKISILATCPNIFEDDCTCVESTMHTENEDKFKSGIFHIGENDLFTRLQLNGNFYFMHAEVKSLITKNKSCIARF